jgi:catalase
LIVSTSPDRSIGVFEGFCQGGEKTVSQMSPGQQAVLFANTGHAMGDTPMEVKLRHIGNCLKADPAYGKGIADALGILLSEVR